MSYRIISYSGRRAKKDRYNDITGGKVGYIWKSYQIKHLNSGRNKNLKIDGDAKISIDKIKKRN